MLWRQGFHINEKQISKLADSQYFRTIKQINKKYFMNWITKTRYTFANETKYGTKIIAYIVKL